MIFKRALQRELSRSFGATLVVLVTIVMSMMMIRTLGLASRGNVNPQEVFLIMAYSVIGHAPTILALSLFITVVSTMARMIKDSEVVIWLSSGKSIGSFAPSLLGFGLPIFITIALMAFLVWPWSNGQLQNLRERYEQRGDLERIAPGEFQESADGKRIIYVDKSAFKDLSTAEATNVFIATSERGRDVITSAQKGRVDIVKGEKFIVLTKGHQLTLDSIKQDIKLIEFETMGSLIGQTEAEQSAGFPNTRSTMTLLRDPKLSNLGELSWRIGIVLASINLMLLALVSASTKPRDSKTSHMLFAILAFVTYYNFINVGQNWIGAGRISFSSTLLLLHGSVFLVILGWFVRRQLRP
jgi:lipopolysaccharide export system permease protein